MLKIDNELRGSQLAGLKPRLWFYFYEGTCAVFWKAFPYLLHQSHTRPKTVSTVGSKENRLWCTDTKCSAHSFKFLKNLHQQNYVYCYWTKKYVYKQF